MKYFTIKKTFAALSVISALLLSLTLITESLSNPKDVYAEEGAVQSNTITVTGKGEIMVAPDVAYVHLGVQTRASTAREAQSKNAETFAAIEKVLFEQYKLNKNDVKTTLFQVDPEYSYDEKQGERKILGYNATHMIQVTYRDLDQLGTFIDHLSAAGANRVDYVQFGTEKMETYELQAIEKAMANAKIKAETIAKASGKQLKEVLAVAEGGTGVPPVLFRGSVALDQAAANKVSTSISPGEIKISTQVTVQYGF